MDDDKNILAKAAGGAPLGPESSRKALWSFILANVAFGSVFVAQIWPPIIVLYLVFPAAIVLGHLGMRDVRKPGSKYHGIGMAIYGLVVGYFCLLLTFMAIYVIRNTPWD